MADVQIIGMDKLIYCLNELPQKVSYRIVIQGLRRSAKPIQTTARQLVPKRKRNLMKSIQIFAGRNRDYPNVWIGPVSGRGRKNDGWYAHFIHFGTKGFGRRTRSGGKTIAYSRKGAGIKAVPFMTDAFTKSKDEAMTQLHSSLQHVIIRFLQNNLPK